jgi:hypothetical protein
MGIPIIDDWDEEESEEEDLRDWDDFELDMKMKEDYYFEHNWPEVQIYE